MQQPYDHYSKEIIRNRMIKNALSYWGVKQEEELDPLVKLLLEALTTELFLLSNDFKDKEAGMLDRVSQLLAPDILTAPVPAHALIHAGPVEASELIGKYDQLLYPKKIASVPNGELDATFDLFFSPVDSLVLFKSQIKAYAAGRHLYDQSERQRRVIATAAEPSDLPYHVVWVGLELDNSIESVEGLCFYFDYRGLAAEMESFYGLLPLMKMYIGDQRIASSPGRYYLRQQKQAANTAADLFSDYDIINMIEKDVKQVYDHKFVSLPKTLSGNLKDLKTTFPEAFRASFPESVLQQMKSELLWIKMVFPEALNPAVPEDLKIHLNVIPVLNRKYCEIKHRLEGIGNIIPVQHEKDDFFLAVHALTDSRNRRYSPAYFRDTALPKKGTYSMRMGGTERFDSRKAHEFLTYLVELLRDESAGFASYGYDFITALVRGLNQQIALMEKKVKQSTAGDLDTPHYILVEPLDDRESFFLNYWTTNCDLANHIRPGSKLIQYKGTSLAANDIRFMSASTGGKSRLQPSERIRAFKYGLMTRDRIVTAEDIRNFFFYELGNKISEVTIKHGVARSEQPRKGLMRTVDIVLSPENPGMIYPAEWQELLSAAKTKLKARSGLMVNYRLMIGEVII